MARREKCGTCKMWHGGFHICVDLTTPEPKLKPRKKGFNGGTQHEGERTEEHRSNHSEAMRRRWAVKLARESPRNQKLVKRYKEGDCGIVVLAKEFGISKDKVMRILHDAQDRGEVVVRKPGQVLAKGAK